MIFVLNLHVKEVFDFMNLGKAGVTPHLLFFCKSWFNPPQRNMTRCFLQSENDPWKYHHNRCHFISIAFICKQVGKKP